jgi:hypothetical protein
MHRPLTLKLLVFSDFSAATPGTAPLELAGKRLPWPPSYSAERE